MEESNQDMVWNGHVQSRVIAEGIEECWKRWYVDTSRMQREAEGKRRIVTNNQNA